MLLSSGILLLLPLVAAGAVQGHHGLEKRRPAACSPVTVTRTVTVTASAVRTPLDNAVTTPKSSTSLSKTSSATKPSTTTRTIASPAPTSNNSAGTLKTSYTGKTSGTATFYGNDGSGGNCKLPARKDLAFVAWPGARWENAHFCGMCLKVTGDKGSTFVQVTNKCPECPEGNLDLSTSAYNKIVSTSGVGPITWTPVDCVSAGLESGTLSYFWKSGSSQYWAGLQVRGAAKPIESVEVASASGAFKKLTREDYNYFTASSGLGAGPFTVKTTFQDGTSKTETGIPLNGHVEDA